MSSSHRIACPDCPVPDPPTVGRLRPRLRRWPADLRRVRAHPSRFGATEFNPGMGVGRFHPFVDPDGHGRQVPTLYAADGEAGALSETVFHDVPRAAEGDRFVFWSDFATWLLSTLTCQRELVLVDLTDEGLQALAVSREQLITSDPAHYHGTHCWARALHAWRADSGQAADGLVWLSRQDPQNLAVVLFGDRVERLADLSVAAAPMPLTFGPGFDVAAELAERAGITIVR